MPKNFNFNLILIFRSLQKQNLKLKKVFISKLIFSDQFHIWSAFALKIDPKHSQILRNLKCVLHVFSMIATKLIKYIYDVFNAESGVKILKSSHDSYEYL